MRRYIVAMEVDDKGYINSPLCKKKPARPYESYDDIEHEIDNWLFNEFDVNKFKFIHPESYIMVYTDDYKDKWIDYLNYLTEWAFEHYEDEEDAYLKDISPMSFKEYLRNYK